MPEPDALSGEAGHAGAVRGASDSAAVADPPAMRAAVVAGPRRIELRSVPCPEPGAGEVRIRIEGCGVCGSSLPLWEGREWFDYPRPAGEPGHEGWGRVDALGAGVEGLAVGDRVAALSQRAYAEFEVVPAAQTVVLPAALDDVPFPGEPLACAMNVFRRSDIGPGHTVAVIGVGFLGAVLVRLAARAGARVIAISRRLFALEVAQQLGAAVTIPLENPGTVLDRVRSLTCDAGCERVIEAIGLQGPLDLAGELTAERGRLVIAGYHQDGTREVNMQMWNWRGIDVINAHERNPQVYLEGMREAVTAVESGALDLDPLLTHALPLDRLGEALELMRSRPDGFLKALVLP